MFSPVSYRKALSVLCLILVLPSLKPLSVQAASQPTKGADIVFLIDQSGSMEDSDPLGLRFDGLQYAIDWLGRTILEYGPEHQYSFRVAVVDFGTYARQALDPIEIAPKSEENWRDVSSFMQNRLAAENRPELGTTEMVPAFEKAAEIYAAWGSPSPDRQRLMILLTDGLPYPDSESAMQQIEEYYTATFPYPAYQLYVIGLSSPDSPWPLFAARWNALSHDQAQAVENRRLLGTYFQRILGQIAQSLGIRAEQVAQCGMIAVAPYLDLARFTVHNPDPAAPVKVYDAGNRLVNGSATNGTTQFGGQVVEVRGHQTPIESITIYNPGPGYWRVECPPGDEGQPMIFVRQVSARGQVQMPGQRLALGVPYAIAFRLFDHSGRPLVQDKDPRYALDVRLSTVATGQTSAKPEDVILRYDSVTQAFQGTLIPAVAGEWVHRLVARTATPDGSDRIVTDIATTSVRVSRPQATVSLQSGRVGQLVPVSLTLTMADSDGRPFVRTSEILNALRAEVTVVDESQTITVPLRSSDSGLYVGPFVSYASGDHSARGRIYLLDPTKPKPVLVAEGLSPTRFVVQPLELTSGLEPSRLTQLVPATVHLSLPAEQADALAPFKDLSSWTAQISRFGPYDTEVFKSVPTKNEIVLRFTPKSVGEFRPELTFTLQRPGGSEPAGTIRQDLGNVRISPPQVITKTVDQTAEPATMCALSAKLLDATGQLFPKTMDQGYDLVVTAHDASGPDTPEIFLKLDDDGVYRSVTPPTSGRTYLLKVEARQNNETIQLVDGVALATPVCGAFGYLAGGGPNRAWLVVIGVVSALLLVLIALGILLWLRRRSQPGPEGDRNPETWGQVVLERPKGNPLAKWDLSNSDHAVQAWDPVEVIAGSEKTICPVGRIALRQSIEESRGETKTGKVGAHVRVFYVDGFDVFNGFRWIDDSISLELKDQWRLTFSAARPSVIPHAPGGEVSAPSPSQSAGGGNIPPHPRPDSDMLQPTPPMPPETGATSPGGSGATTPSVGDRVSTRPRPDSEDLAAKKDA